MQVRNAAGELLDGDAQELANELEQTVYVYGPEDTEETCTPVEPQWQEQSLSCAQWDRGAYEARRNR